MKPRLPLTIGFAIFSSNVKEKTGDIQIKNQDIKSVPEVVGRYNTLCQTMSPIFTHFNTILTKTKIVIGMCDDNHYAM